jgi:hypothetical protein
MALPGIDNPAMDKYAEQKATESNKKTETKKASAEDIAKMYAGYGSSSTGGGAKDPLVFLGFGELSAPVTPKGPYASGYQPSPLLFGGGITHKTVPLSQVAGQYYDWDQKTKDKFLTQLGLAGYDTTKMRDSDVASLWANYSQQAGAYYKNGAGEAVTPWDILAKDRRQREAYLATPRTETRTSTQVQLSTTQDAHAIFLQSAKSLLGRDPTKAEIKSFQEQLNAYERANPQKVTTTTNLVGDTVKSQSETATGGVSGEARTLLAMEDIKKDPEYGAYQAATSGMSWLMEMVQGG